MPDISRSDSNRSDASRPRVSFNRDVHVKRINGPRTANAYSLSSDGTSFVPTSVRRERPMTKKEMTKEAEVVLRQVDKVSCTATSSPTEEKPKKKKRKDSFSFLKKFDKTPQEKTKNSSSDYDSASSQEVRIYKVNGPANNSINNNKITDFGAVKGKRTEKKNYDFMSLDRKKLKKEKKNKNLEYLSLERDNDVLEKMKKEKPKTLLSMVFDGKGKKTGSESPETTKPKPRITLDMPDGSGKKKPLSPIIESPGVDYFDRKVETNVDKMVKKLSEKTIPKLNVKTGTTGVKEPHGDTCHNDNKPFSYTSGTDSGLDNGKDLKSTSPTNDVIYAQVVVGGRDGNAHKATVNERVASNEVGRVFVGDESNQSQVGLNYKTNSIRNDDGGVCEIVDGDETREFIGHKMDLYGENPARRDLYRRKSIEEECGTPSPTGDHYTRVIKVAPKYEPMKRSPTDLHDLSIRREILLSRSESQAKERFNSLKRLQEPARVKRHTPNGIRPGEKIIKNDKTEVRYLGDDIRVNEKFATSLRKIPKDVELLDGRKKRESKLETHLKEKVEKEEKQQQRIGDKGHVIVTDDDDNLLRKLGRLGKSKSFIQEKPKNKKMEKVKMLFMKKKEGKSSESDDDLANRYIEYRGSDVEMSDRSTDSSPRRTIYRTETVPLENSYDGRRKLPSPNFDSMGTLTRIKNDKNKESHWLKTLDKVGKKGKSKSKVEETSSEITNPSKPTNLRFFGDTDQESMTNDGDLPDLKLKYGLYRGGGKVSDSDDDPLAVPSRPESRMTDSTLKGSSTGKYKSKYDLDRPDYGLKQMNHGLQISSNKNESFPSNLSDSSTLQNDEYDVNGLKYGPSVRRSLSSVTNTTPKYVNKEKLRNLKSTPTTSITTPEEPLARRVKSQGNLYSQGGRRRLYDSSADSATEGDSSQHSSKSMIYLHAATVGDIPGPRNIYKSDKRSQSREELSSSGDSTILTPGKKTLSRSISVLAPWRPKHNKEDRTLHYDSADYNKGKPPTGMGKNKRSSSRERKHNELRFNTIGKESRRRKDLLR